MLLTKVKRTHSVHWLSNSGWNKCTRVQLGFGLPATSKLTATTHHYCCEGVAH